METTELSLRLSVKFLVFHFIEWRRKQDVSKEEVPFFLHMLQASYYLSQEIYKTTHCSKARVENKI